MPPYLLLSLILGGIYGTIFHLWRGKSVKDLVIYLITGIIGFIIGQALGNLLGLKIFLIGPLHIIEATVISWISLFVAQWLKI
jgi:uncharacterized membrane protein YeaQ/YmgE (transglycosylase-associated protein family)